MSTTIQQQGVLPVNVRWMIRKDMPEVEAIENRSSDYPWCEDDFIRCLRKRNCIGMVAVHDDIVAGFMVYELSKDRLHVLPTTSHPDYPKEMRVRRFYPPQSELGGRWEKYFQDEKHEPANGDEPLSYCYCSSNGPHRVPHFSGDEGDCKDMEKEIVRRKLWDKYREILAGTIGAVRKNGTVNDKKVHFATCEQRCIAALAAVGSKYVTLEKVSLETGDVVEVVN